MFGREQNLPLDIMFGAPPRHDAKYRCPVQYVEWLRQSMQKAHEYARVHTQVAASRQKRNYDTRCRPIRYEVGQYVWRWIPPVGSKKLARGWHGPFKVMGRATNVNYYIQLTPESRQVRVHVDSLKPHLGRVPLKWKEHVGTDPEGSEASTTSDASEGVLSSQEDKEPEVRPVSPPSADAAEGGGSLYNSRETSPSTDDVDLRRDNRVRKPPARLDL
jgi:hypothetical protein